MWCPSSEFFWPVFSRITTEYRDLQGKSRHTAQMRENKDQQNSEYGHFSRRAFALFIILTRNDFL